MNIFNILLGIHIATGTLSLFVGGYIMFARKGDNRHKKIGNNYYYSMLINACTAIPMSYLHPNLFLFLIGIWTLYMLITGKRYLKLKSMNDVSEIDWIITIISAITAMVFLFLGFKFLSGSNSFGYVVISFASLMSLMAIQDFLNYKGKSKVKNFFITTHIQRMVGSYIATTTAFLVVNNTVLPSILAWLLPTIVLTPFIVVWSRKWRTISYKH